MNIIYKIYLQDKTTILVFNFIILILGILFGSIALGQIDSSLRHSLFTTLNSFLQGYNNLNYDQTVLISEITRIYYGSLFLIWLMGLSVIALPLIPVVLFIKGFALGFSTVFLISYFELKGFLLVLFTVFPQNLFSLPVYFLASITAISFSIQILNYFRSDCKLSLVDFIDYFLKILLLGVFLLGSILIETFVSPFLFTQILKLF